MTQADIKTGDVVTFRAGPRSTSDTKATVTGRAGAFLLTKDSAGKERKVRPGSCQKAA